MSVFVSEDTSLSVCMCVCACVVGFLSLSNVVCSIHNTIINPNFAINRSSTGQSEALQLNMMQVSAIEKLFQKTGINPTELSGTPVLVLTEMGMEMGMGIEMGMEMGMEMVA